MKKKSAKIETVLVLKSVNPDMTAHGGFLWPESGAVKCPDWEETPECGHGLHGWLWAHGDFSLKVNNPAAKWLVVEVDASKIVSLDNGQKVKFPEGNVVFCGTFGQAFRMIFDELVKREKMEAFASDPNVNASATGDSGHASATGYYGHASATGYSGHASATGYSGHASATGDYGHASATGYYGHASATGDSGHASATGYSGHASATGDYGHASATGKYGHASATGYYGHASATGDYGHASATGKYGAAACLSTSGRAKAAAGGSFILTWFDHSADRLRHVVAYPGENDIKADTWYRLDSNGNLHIDTEQE